MTVSDSLLRQPNRDDTALSVLNDPCRGCALPQAFTIDSSRPLSRRSKLVAKIMGLAAIRRVGHARSSSGMVAPIKGEANMARFEMGDVDGGTLGATVGADVFFELGMMYSTGRSVPTDFVTAHKWFNIAATRGNREAIRYRREIAGEMSEAEIATAQRAARDWLKAGNAEPELRAAA
jgi:hypothetical protein